MIGALAAWSLKSLSITIKRVAAQKESRETQIEEESKRKKRKRETNAFKAGGQTKVASAEVLKK